MNLRKLITFLVLLNPVILFSQTGSPIDVLHYRFDIALNDNNDTIRGAAKIKFVCLGTMYAVDFELANTVGGKGMEVEEVTYIFGNKIINPKFLHTVDKVNIQIPTLKEKDTAYVIIKYKGIPKDGLIISRNKYGKRTFFSDNWPNRAHNWLPVVDQPGDKSTVEFLVTAPNHYQVVSNGIMVEESNLANNMRLTHWKENKPLPTKIMVIGVADFAVSLAGVVNGIPVYSWVYPQQRGGGFHDYAMALEILPWFIRNVGPYAYDKLANVQSKTIFGGMENANTIFYHENSIDSQGTAEGLIVHEIAHQWFGNMATEKNFAHLWLSEGFASYMTILYLQDKYGLDTALHILKDDRKKVIQFAKKSPLPVVDPYTRDYMKLLNPNSYEKGSWVLHMLRKEIGDSAFWQGVRKYYSTYAGKNADTEDLRKIFEEISGKDLKQFFKQWLYTAGHPVLKVDWSYDEKSKQMKVQVDQQQKEVFTFPLDVKLTNAEGKNVYSSLKITRASETFYLPSIENPTQLILDPDTFLLYEGKVNRK